MFQQTRALYGIPFLLMALLLFTHGHAGEWASRDNLQARLVPTPDHKTIDAMLEIRLTEGWHTYWKNPGDSGLPPRFDWSKSTNVENVNIAWPFPKRFDEFGLQTFGYKDTVYFPLAITKTDGEADTMLNLTLDIMTCKEICVPDQLKLSASLDTNENPLSTRMVEFKHRLIPHEGDTEGLKLESVVLGPDGIVFTAFSKKGFNRADVFPILGDLPFTGIPEIIPDEQDNRKAMIKIAKPSEIENLPADLQGKTLTVTFVAEKKAIVKNFTF